MKIQSVTITRKQKVLLFMLGAIIFSVWLWWWLGMQQDKKNEVGTAASAALTNEDVARYTTLSGELYDFSADRGKVRVITLWASWSPFSKNDFITLASLADEYQDEDVRFIALNRSEPKDRAEAYLRQFPLAETVTVVLDPEDNLYQQVEGYAMPETIIYSPSGEETARYRGQLSPAKAKATIDNLLSEQ